MIDLFNLYAWLNEDNYKKLDLDEMYQGVKNSLENSIVDYKKYSSIFLLGDFLEMDQQVKVNGSIVGTADLDDDKLEGSTAVCPENLELKIVHCFESSEFIPIPKSPFKIIAIKPAAHNGSDHTISKVDYEEDTSVSPISGTVNQNGIAEVKLPDEFSGKHIKIIFYPDIKQKDIDNLLQSYDSTVDNLSAWFDKYWVKQKKEWEAFIRDGMSIADSEKQYVKSFYNEIVKAWDDIKTIITVFSDPIKYGTKLAKYIDKPEEFIEAIKKGDEKVQNLMTFLKDEIRMFIVFHAVYLRFSLMTPKQMQSFTSVALSKILVTALLCYATRGSYLFSKVSTQILNTSTFTSMIAE